MIKKDHFCRKYREKYLDQSKLRTLATECGFEVRTIHAGKNEILQIRSSKNEIFSDVSDWVTNHETNIKQRAIQAVERAERLGLTGIGESVQHGDSQPGEATDLDLIEYMDKEYAKAFDYFSKHKAAIAANVNIEVQRSYAANFTMEAVQKVCKMKDRDDLLRDVDKAMTQK